MEMHVASVKMVTFEALQSYVSYSRTHLRRLEKQGKFPQRVRMGNCPRRGRIMWVETEVEAWRQERMAKR